MDSETRLPTVEACVAFLDKINEGRALLGLDVLDALDYDAATPNHWRACLSYNALVDPVGGGYVGVETFNFTEQTDRVKVLATNWGWDRDVTQYVRVEIPAEILKITELFDDSEDFALRAALRQRMLEAGVIKVGVFA